MFCCGDKRHMHIHTHIPARTPAHTHTRTHAHTDTDTRTDTYYLRLDPIDNQEPFLPKDADNALLSIRAIDRVSGKQAVLFQGGLESDGPCSTYENVEDVHSSSDDEYHLTMDDDYGLRENEMHRVSYSTYIEFGSGDLFVHF